MKKSDVEFVSEPASLSAGLDPQRLSEDLERLRNAVRKVMNQRGDDRCHQDLTELFRLLPEGDTRPREDTLVTLENCRKYIEAYHDPGITYVSPQRRIEELSRTAK